MHELFFYIGFGYMFCRLKNFNAFKTRASIKFNCYYFCRFSADGK